MKVFSCESPNSRHLSRLSTADTCPVSAQQTSFLSQHQISGLFQKETFVLSHNDRHVSCLNSKHPSKCCAQLLATRTLTLVPQLLSAFLQFCFVPMDELLPQCVFLRRYHTWTSRTLREVFNAWRIAMSIALQELLENLEDVDQISIAETADFHSDQETTSNNSTADDPPQWHWDDELGLTINIGWMPTRRPPSRPPTPS